MQDSQRSQPAVILIHGIGGHWLVMQPMASRLKHKGYLVTNWGYASLWRDIPAHAAAFCAEVRRLDEAPQIPVLHIVAHSMGSIVTRVMLNNYVPRKLMRVVMVCPPNRGSRWATRLRPWLGWLSPSLRQLDAQPESFVNSLNSRIPPKIEVGIIRAEYDWLVEADQTLLTEAVATVTLPGTHTSVLLQKSTADLIDSFLRHGVFS